jgi:hypothetical protein
MGRLQLYISKFLRLDTPEKLAIIRFLFILFRAKFLVQFVPLKYYYHKVFLHKWNQKFEMQQYFDLFSLLKKVVRKIPIQITCLEESIAIQLYFRKLKIDSPVYLGIRKEIDDNIYAHAWSSFEGCYKENYVLINADEDKRI